jgi:hypothetical protein
MGRYAMLNCLGGVLPFATPAKEDRGVGTAGVKRRIEYLLKRPILTPSLQCSNWTRSVERYSAQQLPAIIAVGLHRMEYIPKEQRVDYPTLVTA